MTNEESTENEAKRISFLCKLPREKHTPPGERCHRANREIEVKGETDSVIVSHTPPRPNELYKQTLKGTSIKFNRAQQ